MSERSYVGIDAINQHHNQEQQLIAVIADQGKTLISRPFQTHPAELEALARFISERCEKPKICIDLANPLAFSLFKVFAHIPGVEMAMLSGAGYQLYLQGLTRAAGVEGCPERAYRLARCAARIF